MNYIAKSLPKIPIYFLAVILISGWFFFGENVTSTLADDSTSTPEVFLPVPDADTSIPDADTPLPASDILPADETVDVPLKPLKERKMTKIVRLNKNVSHRCGAETFKIDLSGETAASARIVLQKGARLEPEEIEIGSLPAGIDITFFQNSDYIYRPAQNETVLDLRITNEVGSQKGNFSIPIIYTKNGSSDSTTECQINVINF